MRVCVLDADRACCGWASARGAPADIVVSLLPAAGVLLSRRLLPTRCRVQDVLLRLLESEGRGEDAVKVEAQKLLNAFHINVLL